MTKMERMQVSLSAASKTDANDTQKHETHLDFGAPRSMHHGDGSAARLRSYRRVGGLVSV